MYVMSEVLGRIFWLCAFSVGFAYIFSVLFGGVFEVRKQPAIIMHDVLGAGMHAISGVIMVPSPCTELSVKTIKVSPTVYTLQFQTWEDPSVDCAQVETERTFNTTTYAPAVGIQFLVYLDEKTVPFQIIPIINGHQKP